MSRIFINYRREDSAASASRIYEWLSERYGDDQVFMDVDTIEPGLDWMKAIDRAVGSADLVLALIGTDWLNELNRRMVEEEDPMRHELETALSRDIRVIPILVNGAKMPRTDELPATLASLTRRHAFEIMRPGDERFRIDKEQLLQLVSRAVGAEAGQQTTQTEPVQATPAQRDPFPATTVEPKPAPALNEEQAVAVELSKWNWGAFLLTFIWGSFNGVWRSWLTIIPIYGIYEWIMLGKHGNQWAWEGKRWNGITAFHATQRKWAIAGLVGWTLFLIIYGSVTSGG